MVWSDLRPDGREPAATADVYQSTPAAVEQGDTFYFCCQTCGNCSRHHSDIDVAVAEAEYHVNAGHNPKEGHDAS